MALYEAHKQRAAAAAVAYVQDGMRVGLGSGSTSAWAVRLLGERIKNEGLKIIGVPTSSVTRKLALEAGIPLLADEAGFELDLALDGADEATRDGALIKGGGGAHLQERIVAAAAREFLVMVDPSKVVKKLGKFPLPVEVFRLGHENVRRQFEAWGAIARLRVDAQKQPFITDQGNYILDCNFLPPTYATPEKLAREIRALPGVADHGLFLNVTTRLIIGTDDGVEELSCR